jgi:hypothetical protein
MTTIPSSYVERMQRASTRFLAVAVALAFWELANVVLRTQEPWDSPDYLSFYLASLGLCAATGICSMSARGAGG